MKKNRLDIDARIMRMRGLGFKQSEIAKKLKISQGTVHNKLQTLKKRCSDEGVDIVFFEMCSKIYLPKILRFLR